MYTLANVTVMVGLSNRRLMRDDCTIDQKQVTLPCAPGEGWVRHSERT